MKKTIYFFVLMAFFLFWLPEMVAQKRFRHQFGLQGTTYFNPALETIRSESNEILLSARERKKSNLYLLLYTLQWDRWYWQLGVGHTRYAYQIENAASTFLINEPNVQITYRGGNAAGKRDFRVWHTAVQYEVLRKARLGILAGINLQMNRYISPEGYTNANDIVVSRWGELNKTDFTAIPSVDVQIQLTKRISAGFFYWLNLPVNRTDGLYFSELSLNSNGTTYRNNIQSNHPQYEHALGMRLMYHLRP